MCVYCCCFRYATATILSLSLTRSLTFFWLPKTCYPNRGSGLCVQKRGNRGRKNQHVRSLKEKDDSTIINTRRQQRFSLSFYRLTGSLSLSLFLCVCVCATLSTVFAPTTELESSFVRQRYRAVLCRDRCVYRVLLVNSSVPFSLFSFIIIIMI